LIELRLLLDLVGKEEGLEGVASVVLEEQIKVAHSLIGRD
jgi:hypothetical protein